MRPVLSEPGRVLRVTVPLMVVLFALSGIWRFRGGTFGTLSSLAWAAFGIVLAATVVFGVSAIAYRNVRRC